MDQLFNKPDLLSAFQSGGLGVLIGVVFAIFGFKPPSPDNLPGIMGIIGIFIGWAAVGHFLNKNSKLSLA